MKPVFKALAHLIFIAGMLAFYLLPASPYEWMREFDPAMSAETIEDTSGDNLVFTFLLLAGIAIAQTALVVTSRKLTEKLLSIGFICGAAIFWALKFWP